MEKIFFVRDESLNEVNEYLAKGWSVKDIEALPLNALSSCFAYIVLEKKNEQGEQN